MTLILEIEYLTSVAFAAVGPDSEVPDWPPQPDRVFSALVATWAARGQSEQEAEALKWLEKLPVPRILASGAEPRTARTAYVPPNDYETPSGKLSNMKWYRDFLSKNIAPPEKGGHKKLWLQAWNVMPDQRKRSGLKERKFPATRPHDAVIRLFWDGDAPEHQTLAALQQLARDTAYVGHSASLTRCRFSLDQGALEMSNAKPPERAVYDGRFAELRRVFDDGRRPLLGARVTPVPQATQERINLFGERWLLLEHVDGEMPDLRACALVAKTIRDALLSGYRRIGLGNEIPEVISGHTADGKPTREIHLAVVALPFAGFPHADGHVMGFALVPPRESTILDDDSFRKALRALAPMDEERGRRILKIKTKEGTPSGKAFSIDLSPTFEPPPNRRSLDPEIYVKRARTLATVTPIALDRHLKEEGRAREDEVRAQIATACRNIGLPEPEEIVADKHSALEGAPSAYPSGKSPGWLRWQLPQSLASRQLTHALIRFAAPVEGPVILGAGRYAGIGLCRPLDSEGR